MFLCALRVACDDEFAYDIPLLALVDIHFGGSFLLHCVFSPGLLFEYFGFGSDRDGITSFLILSFNASFVDSGGSFGFTGKITLEKNE